MSTYKCVLCENGSRFNQPFTRDNIPTKVICIHNIYYVLGNIGMYSQPT